MCSPPHLDFTVCGSNLVLVPNLIVGLSTCLGPCLLTRSSSLALRPISFLPLLLCSPLLLSPINVFSVFTTTGSFPTVLSSAPVCHCGTGERSFYCRRFERSIFFMVIVVSICTMFCLSHLLYPF